MPDPATGELKVDPDIVLKAKKCNLAINFFYSSFAIANAQYGMARSASVNDYVHSSTDGQVNI